MDKYQYTVEGIDYEVEITDIENDIAHVTVNGKEFEVKLKQPLKKKPQLSVVKMETLKAQTQTKQVKTNETPAQMAGKGVKVQAPLPGIITEVKVAVGDMVKSGDTVVVLEAMKMQNSIEAENTGKVTSVLVKQGDSVMEGVTLITIEE